MTSAVSWDEKLRRRLVEEPGSLGDRSRQRRWEQFVGVFPDLDRMRVLDLGGRLEFWSRAPLRPHSLVLVNLLEGEGRRSEWFEEVRADACDLPSTILERGYDLVFSNSLIEHLGGYSARCAFADTVRRASPRHWIQTPYRYFPLEPHWLFPGFQFLPLSMKARIATCWPLNHPRPSSRRSAIASSLGVELIDRTEMAYHFPQSRIMHERFLGLPKSLVALRA